MIRNKAECKMVMNIKVAVFIKANVMLLVKCNSYRSSNVMVQDSTMPHLRLNFLMGGNSTCIYVSYDVGLGTQRNAENNEWNKGSIRPVLF